jgi:hypothetical protein
VIFRSGIAAHAQPARPAAAKAGNANFQSGFTESRVVHRTIVQAVPIVQTVQNVLRDGLNDLNGLNVLN